MYQYESCPFICINSFVKENAIVILIKQMIMKLFIYKFNSCII